MVRGDIVVSFLVVESAMRFRIGEGDFPVRVLLSRLWVRVGEHTRSRLLRSRDGVSGVRRGDREGLRAGL